MSPQAGWRHDHVEALPRTGFTRCPRCYKRILLAGSSPEAACYLHELSGGCSAYVAPKLRAARKTKKERNAGPTNSPTRMNDWTAVFDG